MQAPVHDETLVRGLIRITTITKYDELVYLEKQNEKKKGGGGLAVPSSLDTNQSKQGRK